MQFPKLSRPPKRCWITVSSLLHGTALTISACKTTPQKGKVDSANLQPKNKSEKLRSTARNDDVAFQAFITRLRQAVQEHDMNEIAGMMTADFGYRLDPPGEGPGVFEYWDQNNVWPELSLVLNETFVVNNVGQGNEYMVSPPEFVADPEKYTGYRAGIQLVNGSWKFAYFVSGQSED